MFYTAFSEYSSYFGKAFELRAGRTEASVQGKVAKVFVSSVYVNTSTFYTVGKNNKKSQSVLKYNYSYAPNSRHILELNSDKTCYRCNKLILSINIDNVT